MPGATAPVCPCTLGERSAVHGPPHFAAAQTYHRQHLADLSRRIHKTSPMHVRCLPRAADALREPDVCELLNQMSSEIRAGSFDEHRLLASKHVDVFDERIGGVAQSSLTLYRRERRASTSTPVDRAPHALPGSQSAEPVPGVSRRVVFRPLILGRREQCRVARSGRRRAEVAGPLSPIVR